MKSKNLLSGIAMALLVIAALVIWLRGGLRERGDAPVQTPSAGGPGVQSFAGLDEFLARDEGRRSKRTRVVFIGLDGAGWPFIDPLIERGELPNLARLKREGAHGRLRSLPCYVSPPSWVTMLTGYLPAKSGVYTYGKFDRVRREFDSVNADDVEVRPVWDVASYSGKTVGVFNVPMTYPSHPVHGVMVAGMMTPVEMGDPISGRPGSQQSRGGDEAGARPKSFSRVLRTVVEDSLNTYRWSLYDTADDGLKSYDTVVLEVLSEDAASDGGTRMGTYTFDVGDFSPWIRIRSKREGRVEDAWCKVAIMKTPDGRYDTRLSPTFFRIDAPYTHPDSLASTLQERFDYYVPSIFLGKELVPHLAREAASHASYFYGLDDWDLYLYVFTQTDNIHHLTGFSPDAVEVYRMVDRFLGQIMDEMGDDCTLVIASDHGFGEYSYGVDLNQYFERLGLLRWQDSRRIDYDRTLVFHNIWHLYLNRELITRDELRRRGVEVPPEEDPVDFFVRYLQEAGRRIESSDGAMSVSVDFRPMAAGAVGTVPDLSVAGAGDEYVVDFLGFENPQTAVLRKLEGSERWWHVRDGIVLVWGDGVRRGFQADTHDIQDVAPTILYLLDLPIATDMDGQIMHGLFEGETLADKTGFAVADYSQIPKRTAVREAGRESLEKKLRSLGYIR